MNAQHLLFCILFVINVMRCHSKNIPGLVGRSRQNNKIEDQINIVENLQYENTGLRHKRNVNPLISAHVYPNNMALKPVASAFSAYMTIGYLKPENLTSIIVPFNGVDFNMGDDYNIQTSTYTCPVDGVYYFSYSVNSGGIQKDGGRNRAFAYLVVDNKNVNEVFCSTTTTENIECQATNSATVQCNRGGVAMVKTLRDDVHIHGSSSHKRTSFTGFLLYPYYVVE